MSIRSLVTVGLLMEASYLSFYLVPEGPPSILLLIAVNVLTYLLFALCVWRIRRPSTDFKNAKLVVPVVVGLGLLFRLTLVPHGVVGSDDIYRYLWDGRVAAAGINPYQYLPTDTHLGHLATAELPSRVNHPDLRSVYPPLAQLFFLISHLLFGDSIAGLKLLLVLADAGTILLLLFLLRLRGAPGALLLVYAWSPLPVLYFGLDGHIDALAILLLIGSMAFLLSARPVRGVVALGLGGLAKLVPLIAVPLLFREARGVRRYVLMAVPLLVVGLAYALFVEPTWGILDSVLTFSSRWEFNGSVFSIVYFLSGSNNVAHLVSAFCMIVFFVYLTMIERPLLEKVFWGFAGFYLLSPVVHPWYLTWLAPLLVLRWADSIFVYLGLSCLANIVVYQYHAAGVWTDSPLLLLCEYGPVFVLLGREAVMKTILVPAGGSTSNQRNG